MKNSCFLHKKPFLIFLAQVRSKWISESCSTAFKGPLCKNLGWVHFFKLFVSGIPVRMVHLKKESAHLYLVSHEKLKKTSQYLEAQFLASQRALAECSIETITDHGSH